MLWLLTRENTVAAEYPYWTVDLAGKVGSIVGVSVSLPAEEPSRVLTLASPYRLMPIIQAGVPDGKVVSSRTYEVGPEGATENVVLRDLTEEELHPPVPVLPSSEYYNVVDNATDARVAQGFRLDGHRFSLSPAAQLNWTGLLATATAGVVQFPVACSCQCHKAAYSLQSTMQLMQFVGTALVTIEVALSAGRALKVRLEGCVTLEDTKAVLDSAEWAAHVG